LPFWRNLLITAGIVFLIAGLSCARSGIKTSIKALPATDEGCATPANYNLIRKKIYSACSPDTATQLEKFIAFYTVFNEDPHGDIDYLFGRFILDNYQTETFAGYFRKLNAEIKPLFGISESKTGLLYNKQHWQSMVSPHTRPNNYQLESLAAEALYRGNFLPASNQAEFSSNIKILEFFYKYYPDSSFLAGYYTNELYFPAVFAGKNKKRYMEIKTLLDETLLIGTNSDFYFLEGNFISARNKPNVIFSRIINPLEPWEEIRVLRTAGTNENRWIQIMFACGKTAFIEREFLDTNTELYSDQKMLAEYRRALKAYYESDYLPAARIISPLTVKNSPALAEKSIVFLYRINGKIAELATARNSPYTGYIRRQPAYFEYDESSKSFKSGNLLVQYMRSRFPRSSYFFYFN